MTPNELKSNMLTNLASLKQTVQDLQHLILTQPPLNSSDFPPYTYGTMVISRERSRQIELWGTKGDEQYTNSELIRAALCYATPPERRNINPESGNVPAGWPVSWKSEWWRPETYERDLEKAGALIAAELDRRWAARPAEVADAARVEDERRNARPISPDGSPADYHTLKLERDAAIRDRSKFHGYLIRIAKALPLSESNDMKLVDEILIGIENLKQAVSAGDEERAELIRHRDEAEAAITRLTAGLAAEESDEPTDDDDDTEVLVTIESMVESVCKGASERLHELPALAVVFDPAADTQVACVSREEVDSLIEQIEDELSNLLQASRPVEDSDEAVECVLAERAQCFQMAVDAINAALEYVPPHYQQTNERILAAIKTRDEFQRGIDGGSGMVEQLLHTIVSSLEMPSKADKPAEEAATTVAEKPTRYWKYTGADKPIWRMNEVGDLVTVREMRPDTRLDGKVVTLEWLLSCDDTVECDEHGTAIAPATALKPPQDLLKQVMDTLTASVGVPSFSDMNAHRDTFASVMLALNSLTESTGRLIQRIAALEAKS